jgi:hypothetical protein
MYSTYLDLKCIDLCIQTHEIQSIDTKRFVIIASKP